MPSNLRIFKNKVLVTEMQFGIIKSAGGIITTDDDGKSEGIKPRWARVYKVGPEVTDVEAGDYVLLKHGRWTRGKLVDTVDQGEIKIYMIDYPDAVLVISKDRPDILDHLHKKY